MCHLLTNLNGKKREKETLKVNKALIENTLCVFLLVPTVECLSFTV